MNNNNHILIDLIAGARPNFMKISPIIDAIHEAQSKHSKLQYRLIHTGQHYDRSMSGGFFEELGIPEPDVNLETGSGTPAEQTSAIMLKYEKLLIEKKSDVCLVVGDVTSTMACSITAQKMHIPVAHVEGGIRSGDWTMPEEINRLVTDAITNWYFTTSDIANDNLKKNGVEENRIFFVGNTMIDTLLKHITNIRKPKIWNDAHLEKKKYFIMTLHRPENVDKENNIKGIINSIIKYSYDLPIVFPVHPRTAKRIKNINLKNDRLYLIEPLGYLEFIYLVKNAKAVITDSGGITEEATVLGVPCMTFRNNTERPETILTGTNELIGTNPDNISHYFNCLFSNQWKTGSIPPLWDGKAATRIVGHLEKFLVKK